MFKSINVLRLNHGQELLTQLNKYCENKGINSAVILGIIGSLEKAKLGTVRKDGKWGQACNEYEGCMSILSGQGSLSEYEGKKIFHVHMCLIDPQKPGELIGGHLHEATVWATVEVYIGELDYQLYREFDPVIGRTALRTPDI